MTGTPILNLEQDPPGARSQEWAILIGALIGFAIVALPDSIRAYFPGFNIVSWILAVHIVVGLHELGHVVAARLVGIPLGGIKVGFFQWFQSGDRWIFRFDARCFLSGMMIPLPPRDGFRPAAFAWMLVAGPLVSALSMLACGLLWLQYGDGAWDWIGSSCWAAALGIFSLIPMSGIFGNSDASRLRQLWKDPNQAEAWMAWVAVSAENLQGVRPRDWTPLLVEKMKSESSANAGRISLELLCYCRLLDLREEDLALVHLENCLALSGKAGKKIQQMFYLEAASASAFHRRNATQARTWRERALKLRKPELEASSSVAIAMCEGRYEDALPDIERSRQYILKRNPGSGTAILALERLAEREDECRRALTSGPATASA